MSSLLPKMRGTATVSQREQEIREMRAALPLNQYLTCIHLVATTGKLPMYDERGGRVEVGDTEVPVSARLDMLQFLINKIMPAQTESKTTAVTAQDFDQVRDKLSTMPMTLLQEIAGEALSELGSRTAKTITAEPHVVRDTSAAAQAIQEALSADEPT